MITLFAILAIVCDYGHTNFPNSPLNWWVAIYSLIAAMSCIMQLIQAYDDHYAGAPQWLLIRSIRPLMYDLTLTLILTLIYSSI